MYKRILDTTIISDEEHAVGQAALNCAPENLPVIKTGRAEFDAFFSSPRLLCGFTSRTVEIDGDDDQEQYTGFRRIPIIAPCNVPCQWLEEWARAKGDQQEYWWTWRGDERNLPTARLCTRVLPEQSVFFCGIDQRAASRITIKRHEAYRISSYQHRYARSGPHAGAWESLPIFQFFWGLPFPLLPQCFQAGTNTNAAPEGGA